MGTDLVNQKEEALQNPAADGQRKFLCKEYTALVADADENTRNIICDRLEDCGISVDGTFDEAEARRLAEEHRYDLTFLNERPEEALAKIDAFLEQVPEERRQYLNMEEDGSEATQKNVIRLFMSGVDVVSAINKNGGIDDYMDLLDIFYTDGLKRRDSLRDKIENQDIQNYTIEVHGLKSAAANIGANDLSAIAKRHEEFGNASDIDSIRAGMDELFDSYDKILAELKRVLMNLEYGSFAKRDESLPPIEREDMIARMKQILEHLEDFQSREASNGMEELLAFRLPEDILGALDKIQVMLKMYEDDDAEDALRELLEKLE